MPVKRTLEVRSQKSILHVHAWSQALLGNPTQDKRLVGSLLGVLTEHNYPTSVENPVDVIVATVHVERMLSQRTCTDLHDPPCAACSPSASMAVVLRPKTLRFPSANDC